MMIVYCSGLVKNSYLIGTLELQNLMFNGIQTIYSWSQEGISRCPCPRRLQRPCRWVRLQEADGRSTEATSRAALAQAHTLLVWSGERGCHSAIPPRHWWNIRRERVCVGSPRIARVLKIQLLNSCIYRRVPIVATENRLIHFTEVFSTNFFMQFL